MSGEQLRKLDVLVAEARGWTMPDQHEAECGWGGAGSCPYFHQPATGVAFMPWFIPRPTTNIADAMELVEEDEWWDFDSPSSKWGPTPTTDWFATWHRRDGPGGSILAAAPTLPLAITLAYLKAKGVEVPE